MMLRLMLGACLIWSGALWAADFEAGVHYTQIQPEPPQGQVGDKIEVLEFFMYSCPHCYHFEPHLKAWKQRKSEDVEFTRVPAMFGRQNNLHAQAYYALEAIGEAERVHGAFFDVIHEQRNPLKTREAVEEFMQSQGVDLEKFRAAMSSFAVAAKTNRATSLLRRYDIRGVPKLVVDGRYASGRGLSYEGMAHLIDYLTTKVREERRLAQSAR